MTAVVGSIAVTALDAALLALALGGLPPLLAHPRALALIAVWGVGGLVLALIRPVRGHDAIAVASESRLAFVALFLIPLVTPAVAALGERFAVFPWFALAPIEWAGVAAVAAGLAVRIAAMSRLGSRFAPIVSLQRGHVLETRGIYSRIRHPGYLGALLACTGAMLAFGNAFAFPLVLMFGVLLRLRIRTEEAALEQHFGDEYRAYRQRTGALLPRLTGPAGRD